MAKSTSKSKSTPSSKPAAKSTTRKTTASKRSASTKSTANATSKKTAAKKPAAKKPAAKTTKSPTKSPTKSAAKKPARTTKAAKPAAKTAKASKNPVAETRPKPPAKPVKMTNFLKKQQARLLELKDGLLDSMNGVARDTLRHRAEGNEASAFGMHQADAGSDAYDRDFALNLLSQEQDALYEIDEALKRIEFGTYGVCEISGKSIPHPRLEALPFTRYTVECQAEIERSNQFRRYRQPATSLFGLGDDDGSDNDNDSND